MLFLFMFVFSVVAQEKKYDRTLKLMGSRFDISVVASSKEHGNNYMDLAVAEIKRIENIISSWNENSETSKINQNAGIKPVKVNKELFDLINRSIQISKITEGAFDISYASMDKIWKFDGSITKSRLPKYYFRLQQANCLFKSQRNENRFWCNWQRLCGR